MTLSCRSVRARQPGLEATGQEGGPQTRSRESAGRTCELLWTLPATTSAQATVHNGGLAASLPRAGATTSQRAVVGCGGRGGAAQEQVVDCLSLRGKLSGEGGAGQDGHRVPLAVPPGTGQALEQ